MYVIGIDPGLTGAIALYDTEKKQVMFVRDMPIMPVIVNKKKRNTFDITGIYRMFADYAACFPGVTAVVERQQAGAAGKQNQGKQKKFFSGSLAVAAKFYGYGILLTCLTVLGIPFIEVMPAVWKNRVMPELEDKSDKEAVRALAIKRFWNQEHQLKRVKDHNRAEAALIAKYEVKDDNNKRPKPRHNAG